MLPFPLLCFPPTALDLKKSTETYFVKCLVRKKWLTLTPEEWVRQHIIAYFLNNLKIPLSYVSVEKSFHYGTLTKRWDILVYSQNYEPYILIECKAPTVTLSNETLFQLFTYQHIVKGTFLGITNGLEAKYFEVTSAEAPLKPITNIPVWS